MYSSSVAVVLSGCGALDGSEITESVALLIALSQQGFTYTLFAPNRQARTVDHLTGEETFASHSILSEAARIARGVVYPINQLDMTNFTALAFPGGMGVLQVFCDFAQTGQKACLHEDIARPILQTLQCHKPVLALCAAPLLQALAAQKMGWLKTSITLGLAKTYPKMVQAVIAWGQRHIEKPVDQACVDPVYKLISAPAYMYPEATAGEIFASCKAAVTGLQSLL